MVELVARTSCTKSSEQRRPFAFHSRMFQKVGDTPDMLDYKRNLGVPFRDSTYRSFFYFKGPYDALDRIYDRHLWVSGVMVGPDCRMKL